VSVWSSLLRVQPHTMDAVTKYVYLLRKRVLNHTQTLQSTLRHFIARFKVIFQLLSRIPCDFHSLLYFRRLEQFCTDFFGSFSIKYQQMMIFSETPSFKRAKKLQIC